MQVHSKQQQNSPSASHMFGVAKKKHTKKNLGKKAVGVIIF